MRLNPRVLLVTMPWDFLFLPSIRLGLLKSALGDRGIPARVEYLNLKFMEFILTSQKNLESSRCFTPSDYFHVSNEVYRHAAGEWLFTHPLYGRSPSPPASYYAFLKRSGADVAFIRKIRALRPLIGPFLEWCMDTIPWERCDVAGFTTMFNQNVPSLALARKVKTKFPRCRIVFGGANCEGPMGLAILKRFPWVDAVIRGEGEEVFPELVEACMRGKAMADLPGVCSRGADGLIVNDAGRKTFSNLDISPLPDYEEYFSTLETLSFGDHVHPFLPLETSRGCWWGMKSHCTFCGLNQNSMRFRSKSPGRVMDEITQQVARYKQLGLYAVDNIMDMKYFDSLLPHLRELGLDLHLYYEMKVNLKKEQIHRLRDAGIRTIQGGVESLSTRHLALLKKGTTAIQNMQFLKWCLEKGVIPFWNHLYAIPGEAPEDYSALLETIGYVTHLPPPINVSPVSLDRFSPYFDNPETFGIRNVRPRESYSFLYPWNGADLFDIAYGFDYDFDFRGNPEDYTREARARIEAWRKHFQPNLLTYSRGPGFLKIRDQRHDVEPKALVLEGWQAEAYTLCDEAKTPNAIARGIENARGDSATGIDLSRFLGDMTRLKLMFQEKGRYLSLAVPFNTEMSVLTTFNHLFRDRLPA